jgi:biopolymer transport protein ExbD
MKLRKKPAGDEDFQMAPMIDMVFLLLVFFMTVSTLAQDEKVSMELPESERSKVPEDASGRGNISLKFAEDGSGTIQYFVGASDVAGIEEIKARIREGVANNPDLEINVRSTADMPFREIKRVLKACAEVGAYKVVYATYQAN